MSESITKHRWEDCPYAREQPTGLREWMEWSERMHRTHDQVRCPGCGRFTVWVRREPSPPSEDAADVPPAPLENVPSPDSITPVSGVAVDGEAGAKFVSESHGRCTVSGMGGRRCDRPAGHEGVHEHHADDGWFVFGASGVAVDGEAGREYDAEVERDAVDELLSGYVEAHGPLNVGTDCDYDGAVRHLRDEGLAIVRVRPTKVEEADDVDA